MIDLATESEGASGQEDSLHQESKVGQNGRTFSEPNSRSYEVICDSSIQGGIPTIKGTRWPIRSIVELVNADGLEETLKNFPAMDRKMIKTAICYATKYPDVMEYDDESVPV